MHALLLKLEKDHQNLQQILELLETQMDAFFAGKESNFDLKLELLDYLKAYADLAHHPVENQIFRVAAAKASSEQAELLNNLEAQHEQLSQLTSGFAKALDSILQGGVMPRDELEHQGREFISLQRKHMDQEEREGFPLVDDLLGESDWEQIEQSLPPHDDPVFGSPDRVRFRNLFSYLQEHADE